MPKISLPKPGTFIDMDDSEDICMVIDPEWNKDQINGAFAYHDYFDMRTTPETHMYRIDTFHYHTNHQKYSDGVGVGWDSYWSPDGQGKSFITVALIEF